MSPKLPPLILAIAAATVVLRAIPVVAATPPAAASTQAPAAASSVPSAAISRDPDARKLKGVTVKGKRDLLGESDARMKKLKESLPDLNSDTGHKESFAQRMFDRTKAYMDKHSDPNKLSADNKAFIERVQNGVDSTQNANRTPVAQPDAKDYSDPLCQTGSCPP